MIASIVKTKLLGVLQDIQASCGQACPPLTGTIKPLEDLPNFDSLIWPVAVCMVASELDITIPDDVNIFSTKVDCIALTIDETIAMLIEIINKQTPVSQSVNVL